MALTLTNFATANRKAGAPERVPALFERALKIREQAFGAVHPDVADTLDRLGEFLAESGDYAGARPVYERVLGISETVHGPDHPHVGVVRQHLAEVLAAAGDVSGAVEMALAAERIGRDHLRLIGRTLPEREALMYAAMRPAGLDVALSLLARQRGGGSISSDAVWDAVVRSRAVVLDEMASRRRTTDADGSADLAALLGTLSTKREQLARLVVRGPAGSGEQYRVDVDAARKARDEAERAVAERSSVFRQEQRERLFGIDETKSGLPPQSALIGFVRYLHHPFGNNGARTASEPAAAYLAFIVRAGDTGPPALVPLGAASGLDEVIARWRKQMAVVALSGGWWRAAQNPRSAGWAPNCGKGSGIRSRRTWGTRIVCSSFPTVPCIS